MKKNIEEDIKLIAKYVAELIKLRAKISNSDQFTGKNLIGSGIGDNSAGNISINSLLYLWDNGFWKEIDSKDSEWFVYKIMDGEYNLFSSAGELRRNKGGRLYKLQYLKERINMPCIWKRINIIDLIAYCEKNKN